MDTAITIQDDIDDDHHHHTHEKQPFLARDNHHQHSNISSSPMDFLHDNRFGAMIMFFTKWGMRAFGWVMVSIASVLFALLITFYFYTVIPLLARDNQFIYFTMVIIGVFLSFNLVFNYFMCIKTSPGSPPPEWLMEMQDKMEELKKSGSTVPGKSFSKFCNRCKQAKPQRAHHCHICDKCVLRMDHHCPWVNNCVGYNNHKYFVLFLFYLWAAAIYVCIALSLVSFSVVPYDGRVWMEWQTWLTFVNVLAGSMGATMTGFFGWHVYLVLTNQTTIEFQFNKFKLITQKRTGKASLNEYDVGLKNNIEQLFGMKRGGWWFTVLLPTLGKPPLDGCTYPTITDFHAYSKTDKVENKV